MGGFRRIKMKNEKLHIRGVCFGEVLWDNLPTGRKLGGAPLNVAYHLNTLGISTDVLTRVGNDSDGDGILELCAALNVPLRLFQKEDVFATSTVEVHIDENRDVRYEIVFPVAWDYIAVGESERKVVAEADFFVFGSLSSRHEVSYRSLISLLHKANYKVLDVNLRSPFYSQERIFELLGYADLVKMNEEELQIIADWMLLPSPFTDREKAGKVMEAFDVEELIVTYGGSGAIYHSRTGNLSYHFPAYRVEVKDTIGSGDSFLAAFLSKRLQSDRHFDPEEVMEFAATLSAYVTQSEGACPGYDAKAINRFQWLTPLYRKMGEEYG